MAVGGQLPEGEASLTSLLHHRDKTMDATSDLIGQDVLLATKMHIPPAHPELIVRPRLFQRLDEGVRRKLTLISASTGFDKTSLKTSETS